MSFTLEMFGGPMDGVKVVARDAPPSYRFQLPRTVVASFFSINTLPTTPQTPTVAVYAGRKHHADRNPNHVRYDFAGLE